MVASTLPSTRSGLYADPREDWLALHTEEIIDPGRPIVDPHHHLWDRSDVRYLMDEITDNSFHWLGEAKPPEAAEWRLVVEVKARRRR